MAKLRTPEEIITEILKSRGIESKAEISEFLSEKPSVSGDPFLLPDMEEGTDLLYSYAAEKKQICIYGDYDVDGIMSVVLLHSFLAGLPGADPDMIKNHIPSREEEGYGLNTDALRQIHKDGAELVITVDCGSVAKTEVEYAKDLGMKVIVSDHHECAEGFEPDCIFIDPKRKSSSYPYPQISGCGVAFKIAQGITKKYYPEEREVGKLLNSMLDLVAVAAIADVVPLTGENRTFSKYGINAINKGKRTALRRLALAIGLKPGKINSHNIAFGIGPHLNAAGRMGDASIAAELFLTEDEKRMGEIIDELIKQNKNRRRAQDEAFAECVSEVEKNYKDSAFILLKPNEIHEGIAGIVAGKLKDIFMRPAAVLTETVTEDGNTALKGSARSIEGFDIISSFRAHEELFIKLGGHAMAAGFVIPEEKEDLLRQMIDDDVRSASLADPELFNDSKKHDIELSLAEASHETAVLIEKIEPCGAGNRMPMIKLTGVFPMDARRMGQDKRHLKFTASDGSEGITSQGLSCVMFGSDESDAVLPADEPPYDFIGELNVNRWNNREEAQFIIREICS